MATKLSSGAMLTRTREEWRSYFFDIIDAAAPVFEKEALAGDRLRILPPETTEVLRSSGLMLLKYPAELGGAEADNALQFEVFERIAFHSSAASWCTFIYADLIAQAAAQLSPAGFALLTKDDAMPLICGGGGGKHGSFVRVPGGFRVSGRWIYGSGIAGADWVTVLIADKDKAEDPEVRACFMPRKELGIIDNWDVLGMRGSGSSDFTAEDVFVPEELTYVYGTPPVRGGGIFRLTPVGYVAHCVPGTSLGIARRVLADATAIAREKARGWIGQQALARRGVFQEFLGEADIKLRAARALMIENGIRLVEEVERDGATNPKTEAEVRAAGTYATQVAVEVVDRAVHFLGGSALKVGSRLEQALRDVHTADTHFIVSDTSFENHAQFLMDLEGANQMA